MSKSDAFLDRLIVASTGVSSAERQAEARVKTNDYFGLNGKEMKGEGVFAAARQTKSEIEALRATASAAGNTVLVEVYDASLSVFATAIGDAA